MSPGRIEPYAPGQHGVRGKVRSVTDGTTALGLLPTASRTRDCPPELDLTPLARLGRRIEIWLNRGQQVHGLGAVQGHHTIRWETYT